MKLNMKKIIGVFVLATAFYSCDTTNESGYVPVEYTSPAAFTIAENAAATTDNEFVVTYTPTSVGKAYYAVVAAGTPAPSSTDVHGGSGFIQADDFDVDGSTPVDITIDSNIFGSYSYDVYAIHKSSDNFISETVTKLTVTTPDTAAPEFLRDDSNPSFQSADISPFAPVVLKFSEPVTYQGGDVTFTGFFGSRTITVNGADNFASDGTTIVIENHGTFAPDDFIVVTWDEGTFKDNAGKSVASLSGLNHYFSTRIFTAPESAALMVGTYNYDTTFWGGFLEDFYTGNAGLFLPTSGEFELKLDPSDPTGTTLLGINLYSPLSDYGYPHPENLKIKFGESGNLAILDEVQAAGSFDEFNGGFPSNWTHYVAGTVNPDPGNYNVEAGTINHYLSVAIASTSVAYSDIDYSYTRIGTYARPSAEDIDKRNALIGKKIEQNKNYKKILYNNKKIK